MSWLQKILRRKPASALDVAGMIVAPERLAALRPSDQFLVSYPRSGNTWVRHVLRDLIVLGHPERPVPEALWMLIPDLHVHAMDHPAREEFGMPTRLFKSHNLRAIAGRRFAYIFRIPADALISNYHFYLREKMAPELTGDGPDAFCRTMLPSWQEHVELALSAKQAAPENVTLISYEMLLADGVRAVQSIARFYGLPTTPENVATAVQGNAFSRLREKEEKDPQNPDEFFFRKGRTGTGREELSPKAFAEIEEAGRQVYETARASAETVW
jgi:hypothetical protein